MSLLTLGLRRFDDVVGVPVGPPTPVHLRDWSLLLQHVITVAALALLPDGVDPTVLTAVCHLKLLLNVDLALAAASRVLELLIVLLVVFARAGWAFARALRLLLLRE